MATGILLVGLPNSGKSTFLAALWQIVVAGDVPGALKLKALADDIERLNLLRHRWLAAETLDHTSLGTESYTKMTLFVDESEDAIEFVLPDLAGESVRQFLETRQWTTEFDNFVRTATAVLMFINPVDTSQPSYIDEAQEVVDMLVSAPAPVSNSSVDWEPKMTPTEVVLVDLLQVLHTKMASHYPIRLGVVISAWDEVCQYVDSPDEWLARELPLVDQYLKANGETITFRVYGVSAQGGKLPDEAVQLASLPQPTQRIRIEGLGCAPHDLSAPLRWLMRGSLGTA